MSLFGAGIGGLLLPSSSQALAQSPQEIYREERSSEFQRRSGSQFYDKCADLYMSQALENSTDPSSLNILYPGSGNDTLPFWIGIRMLHDTPLERVHFEYTEIGDSRVAWFENIKDLREGVDNQINWFGKLTKLRDVKKTDHGVLKTEEGEFQKSETRYSLEVPTAQGPKELILNVGFNMVEQRKPLTPREREHFGEEFIHKAQENYWPAGIDPKAFSPKYARDDQFAESDIIISKKCGDHGLLQLDILRFLLAHPEAGQKVVIEEYPKKAHALTHPLPGHRATAYSFRGESHGYNNKRIRKEIGEVYPGAVIYAKKDQK